MAKSVKVTSYLKNVGASFGYVVKDVVADYNPTLREIISDTKYTYQDAKDTISRIKNDNISNAVKDFKSNTNILSNTIDDLKSGKWYNKSHEDNSDMFGLDFDFDDDDWGDDWDSDDEDSSADTDKIIAHDT